MSIGHKIRKIRELRNYTQEHLADRLGMSIAGYGKIERDDTDIPFSRLEQIANTLGVRVEDITSFDDKYIFNLNNNEFKDFIVNNQVSEKERELYEKTIKVLEEKNKILEEMNQMLKAK